MTPCNHKWQITDTGPSPATHKPVPQNRQCTICGRRQYKVWKYNPTTKQFQTHWRSS